MEQKSWIFIATHGHAGEALLRSAEMIMGKMKCVEIFSLEAGMSPEDILEQIRKKLDIVNEPVLILTDLYGGTPFNVGMALSRNYDLQLVCGLNLSMIIESDLLRENLAGEELAEAVRKVGSEACCVAKLPSQNVNERSVI
jgi:Phosphotransferase system, mannose/fructose-specific component IIA